MPESFRATSVLKEDAFGRVELGHAIVGGREVRAVRRDVRAGPILSRPLACFFAWREVEVLRRLEGVEGVPQILSVRSGYVLRSFVPGLPLNKAEHRTPEWFARAEKLLSALHERGVTHNDLHKAANCIVTPDGGAALVDYQLAFAHRLRGPWFRMCVREDRRHLMKHKGWYAPELMSEADWASLQRRSFLARASRGFKPTYLYVTRTLLGMRDSDVYGWERGSRPLDVEEMNRD